MKKRFSIYVLIVLSILFSSIYYTKTHLNEESPETTLIKSFDNSGAKVVNSEIYFWARIDKAYKNLKDLSRLADNVSEGLGIGKNSNYIKNSVSNDMMDKIEIKGITDKGQAISVSVRLDQKDKNVLERIISGTIIQELSSDWLAEEGTKITKVFNKYDITPDINTCIVGSFDGLLDDNRLEEVAQGILRGADARKIEGIRDNKLISVSAYSPNISDSIKVNGKRVNLNLAIRYNDYENKTYIWLATPVITKEY
jgi:TATA-box binding